MKINLKITLTEDEILKCIVNQDLMEKVGKAIKEGDMELEIEGYDKRGKRESVNAKISPENKNLELQNAPEQKPIEKRSGRIPDVLKDPRWLAFWLDRNHISMKEAAQLCGVSDSTIERASQGFFLRTVSFRKIVEGLGLSDGEALEFKKSLTKHQRWVY